MIKNFNKYWNYGKYQIFTKLITAIIFLPIFYILRDLLVKSTGRTGISSGDYLGFLLTPQGILLILISFLFFVLLIGMDLNAFIVMSYLLEENYKLKMRDIFKIAIKSVKKFLNPLGIIFVLYIGLILPLLGFGLSFGPLAKFQIPNFIMSVIENTPLYFSIYISLMLLLTLVLFFGIFSVHFILLFDEKVGVAFKNSFNLIKKNWKDFLKKIIKVVLKLILMFIVVFVIFLLLLSVPILSLNLGKLAQRVYLFFSISLFSTLMGLLVFIALPLQVDKLSTWFKEYIEKEERKIPEIKEKFNIKNLEKSKYKFKFKFLISVLVLIFLVFNLFISFIGGYFFDEIFKQDIDIKIVAHRAGGDLAAENSLKGLELAIKENAVYSEIDIQRTKDGYYVVNHDKTFSRLSGVNKSSSEMTLEEIKNLTIKDEFDKTRDSQKVSTLEEMLEVSKGKIGLFIELKGQTADEKMVEDVVKILKEKNMEKEVALISLDYKIIQYIEKNYPQIETGFLYFFSFGDVKELEGDILIMEEKEATDENIENIHSVGKKAIVWTVNTDESISKFIEKDVDGIITDHILKLKNKITNRNKRTDLEIIIDTIFGE